MYLQFVASGVKESYHHLVSDFFCRVGVVITMKVPRKLALGEESLP